MGFNKNSEFEGFKYSIFCSSIKVFILEITNVGFLLNI
jgi:hypothetical protein